MTGLAVFLTLHTVQVESWAGPGAFGDTFSTSASVPGFLEDGAKVVRTATDDEVVSSTSFYTALANAGLFAVGSRVTVWGGPPSGRVARVLSVERHDGGTLLGNVAHAEIHLT